MEFSSGVFTLLKMSFNVLRMCVSVVYSTDSPRLTIVDPNSLMLNYYKRTSKLRLYHLTSYKVIAISRGKFLEIVLFNAFFYLLHSAIFKLAPVFAQKSEGKRLILHACGQFSVERKAQGGYSGFQVTGMIEWSQKSRPKKIPRASKPKKILRSSPSLEIPSTPPPPRWGVR